MSLARAPRTPTPSGIVQGQDAGFWFPLWGFESLSPSKLRSAFWLAPPRNCGPRRRWLAPCDAPAGAPPDLDTSAWTPGRGPRGEDALRRALRRALERLALPSRSLRRAHEEARLARGVCLSAHAAWLGGHPELAAPRRRGSTRHGPALRRRGDAAELQPERALAGPLPRGQRAEDLRRAPRGHRALAGGAARERERAGAGHPLRGRAGRRRHPPAQRERAPGSHGDPRALRGPRGPPRGAPAHRPARVRVERRRSEPRPLQPEGQRPRLDRVDRAEPRVCAPPRDGRPPRLPGGPPGWPPPALARRRHPRVDRHGPQRARAPTCPRQRGRRVPLPREGARARGLRLLSLGRAPGGELPRARLRALSRGRERAALPSGACCGTTSTRSPSPRAEGSAPRSFTW